MVEWVAGGNWREVRVRVQINYRFSSYEAVVPRDSKSLLVLSTVEEVDWHQTPLSIRLPWV